MVKNADHVSYMVLNHTGCTHNQIMIFLLASSLLLSEFAISKNYNLTHHLQPNQDFWSNGLSSEKYSVVCRVRSYERAAGKKAKLLYTQ